MDREQDELQFLGTFGIYKESFKIIYNWRRIFSQITLTFILPLSFIFLAHTEISNLLLSNIVTNSTAFDETHQQKISDVTTNEWLAYWLFELAYFISMLVFGLLSTSAVVYTIASVYTSGEVTFGTIISVVPKVWKRVMVTFLCTFLAYFVYNVVAMIILFFYFFATFISQPTRSNVSIFIGIMLLGVYVIGFLYMTLIWHLASVVSVLEETKGFKAMAKSKNLLKGKMWVAALVFFTLSVLGGGLHFAFQISVVNGSVFGTIGRVGFGVLRLVVLCMLFLLGLVIQTVLYFVCKSYHHEVIDKSALSDHLKVIYIGDLCLLSLRMFSLSRFEVCNNVIWSVDPKCLPADLDIVGDFG